MGKKKGAAIDKVKKSKKKVTIDEKKTNATPNESMFKKLTPIYKNIKIDKKQLMPGVYYYCFNDVPKSLSLNLKSDGHVIYLDDENAAIGKIKKVTDKYCRVLIEDRSFPTIDLFLEQVILLKEDTKLYKKLKK